MEERLTVIGMQDAAHTEPRGGAYSGLIRSVDRWPSSQTVIGPRLPPDSNTQITHTTEIHVIFGRSDAKPRAQKKPPSILGTAKSAIRCSSNSRTMRTNNRCV